jgi:uncharacterized membrane protein
MDRRERITLANLITWLIVGLVIVLLGRLLLPLLRFTLGLASFLVSVVVLIVIGWIALTLWQRYSRRRDTRL